MVSMSHTHLFAKINIFHDWEILGDTQNKSVNITAMDKNKFSEGGHEVRCPFILASTI